MVIFVERNQGAWVNYLAADPFLGELVGCLQGFLDHFTDGDNGDIASLTGDPCFSKGITKLSSSGTGPLSPYNNLCSKNMTGSSPRIAVLSSPFASAGVEGTTIFRPGIFINQDSALWECCAAEEPERRSSPE